MRGGDTLYVCVAASYFVFMEVIMKKRFCIECDAIRPCHLSWRKITLFRRGIAFTYFEKYLLCSVCGSEVYDGKIADANVKARLKAYAQGVIKIEREEM